MLSEWILRPIPQKGTHVLYCKSHPKLVLRSHGNQLGDCSPCFVNQMCFIYQVFRTFVCMSIGCYCSDPQSWKETSFLSGWWLLKICKWPDCLRQWNGCCWCPVLSCEWRKESDIISPAPRGREHCRRADGKNTRDSKGCSVVKLLLLN